MLGRRQILLAAAASGALACTQKQPPPATKPGSPRTTTHAGLEMIELFPNDADEKAPFLVVIHGMGDRPQHWVEGWSHFPSRAHVILPRAFTPYGDGYSWFPYAPDRTDEQLGASVGEAEARLWPGVLEVAAGRKIIVTGFSQGGILSYVMAARHPDVVTNAFPIAGACPKALLPANKAAASPVLAFHGTADTMIPIQRDRDTILAFKTNGNQAELREYEGVGHAITPSMRADWYEALGRAIKAA